MQAHIEKDGKIKCINMKIQMIYIFGFLTPFQQTKDIEIFKLFKDYLFSVIDVWKIQ